MDYLKTTKQFKINNSVYENVRIVGYVWELDSRSTFKPILGPQLHS